MKSSVYATLKYFDTIMCRYICVAEQIKNIGIEILPKISNPKDLDNCVTTGVYMCGGTAASNAPTNSPYGTLVVFSYSSDDSGYTVQLFLSRSASRKCYIRLLGSSWIEIA